MRASPRARRLARVCERTAMINEKMYGLGDEPSAIRELFAYGMLIL